MEKITFNNEQLESLKFIVQDFEYNDDHERYMIEQIENKIYQACLLYTSPSPRD